MSFFADYFDDGVYVFFTEGFGFGFYHDSDDGFGAGFSDQDAAGVSEEASYLFDLILDVVVILGFWFALDSDILQNLWVNLDWFD